MPDVLDAVAVGVQPVSIALVAHAWEGHAVHGPIVGAHEGDLSGVLVVLAAYVPILLDDGFARDRGVHYVVKE